MKGFKRITFGSLAASAPAATTKASAAGAAPGPASTATSTSTAPAKWADWAASAMLPAAIVQEGQDFRHRQALTQLALSFPAAEKEALNAFHGKIMAVAVLTTRSTVEV
jgi:hypothetical protein